MNRAILQEAQLARKAIIKGLTSQSPAGKRFKRLSDLTRAMRKASGFRGRKALIRTGTLRRSIIVKKIPGGAFVGILRTAKMKGGQRVANIAQIQEEGRTIVIRVTPKMKRWFFWQLRKAKIKKKGKSSGGFRRGIIVVKIPPRPFMSPVFEELQKGFGPRYAARVALLLNGDYGKP